MESRKLHVLAIALLSVLLVNLETEAVSIQDTLPTLVLDDEPNKAKAVDTTSENVQSNPNPLETVITKDEKDDKLVPYSTSLETEAPSQVNSTAAVAAEKEPEAAKEEPAKEEPARESSTAAPKEVATSQANTSEATTTPKSVESSSISSTEKDISVLLANKDDAENDLASPTQVPESNNSKPSEGSKKAVDLDAPVDTVKSVASNDDRLHYALGDKPSAGEETKPAVEAAPVDTVVKEEAKPEGKPMIAASDSVNKEEEQKPVVKEVESGEKPVDDGPKKADAPSEVDSSTSKQEETSSSQPSTTASESDSSSSELPSSTTTSEPLKPKKDSDVPASSAGPETSSASTTVTTVTTTTQASKAASEKPESVPSILAVALGTALGAAVNPLLPKEKPAVNSPPTTTTSTTKVPTTVRKSSTDKWERWTPTTSTAPPTRRRPILPSIRRRFRPYNRFSPFPWGGADSYSPAGDPEFFATDMSPKASSTTTNRPKRRHQTNSTSEPRSSTTSSPPSSSPEDSSEEVSTRPEESTRRRPNGKENRRRHHHHHHHHSHDFNGRRRHQSSPKSELPYPSERPNFGEPSPFDSNHHSQRPALPGFNFFNSAGGSSGSSFDLLNPFSGWLDDLKPKPPSRNPIHNPPTYASAPRPFGSRPVAVEGEYNDELGPHRGPHRPSRDEYDHEHDHHHEHDHDHDHHHHDCHDHDYDHHHNNRPLRPPREPYRPPVGGDYDTPGYGRRPNRPYNRRDQAEVERNREAESSEASPSLYSPRLPGASAAGQPRRVPSIFSPFDSLFGALDDELFSLRSTFIDVPSKPDSSHAFDAIVSSPKISLPAAKEPEAEREKDKEKESRLSSASQESSSNNNNNHGKPESELAEASDESSPEFRAGNTRVFANQQPCSFPGRGLLCLFSHQPLIELFRRI